MNREEEQQWNVEDEEGITAISLSSVRVTVTKLSPFSAIVVVVVGTSLTCGGYRSSVQSIQGVTPGRITLAFPLKPVRVWPHKISYQGLEVCCAYSVRR